MTFGHIYGAIARAHALDVPPRVDMIVIGLAISSAMPMHHIAPKTRLMP